MNVTVPERGHAREPAGPFPARRRRPAPALRSSSRHPLLRYAQIIPVGLLLWGLDAADKLRPGAASAGRGHALAVAAVSRQLGGAFALPVNDWLAAHPGAATAAAWYYVLAQGTVTGIAGIAGLLLIWRRAPAFRLHRNALVMCNLIGLVVFWLYPVAPPRMLPGYHDITATAAPLFSGVLENKAADQFASLPSLHVAWALWAALAAGAVLRHPVLRAAAWVYPAATAADVLATANHYLLDVITAPGVVLLAYAVAASPALGRRIGLRAPWRWRGPGKDASRADRPGIG